MTMHSLLGEREIVKTCHMLDMFDDFVGIHAIDDAGILHEGLFVTECTKHICMSRREDGIRTTREKTFA